MGVSIWFILIIVSAMNRPTKIIRRNNEMKKLCSILLILCFTFTLLIPAALAADSTITIAYDLTANGSSAVTVRQGDIITVTFSIRRTDAADNYRFSVFQNEIIYDQSFFEFVDGSITREKPGDNDSIAFQTRTTGVHIVKASDMSVSYTADEDFCTFRLKVIAASGQGVVSCSEALAFDRDSDAIKITEGKLTATIESTGGGGDFGGGGTNIGDDEVPLDELPDVTIDQFEDVNEDNWFYDAAAYVVERGWFRGVSATQFDPNGKMTRAMFITIISRMEGIDESDYPSSGFDDIADGEWYTAAVAWGSENGIVLGVGQNRYAPNDILTREQMVTMLYRYTNFKQATLSENGAELEAFPDYESVSDWAEEAMRWGTKHGVINGTGVGLAPGIGATRAEMAQALMNYAEAQK